MANVIWPEVQLPSAGSDGRQAVFGGDIQQLRISGEEMPLLWLQALAYGGATVPLGSFERAGCIRIGEGFRPETHGTNHQSITLEGGQ
jgi:hypothetical protein